MIAPRVVGAFLLLGAAGCDLFVDFGGLSGGTRDGGTAPGSDGAAPTEGGADAAAADGDAATSGYAAAVLADQPLAYWRFAETSGTRAKDETGRHDGTYRGLVTLGASGAMGDGAVRLDGHTGYVDMGDVFGFAGASPMSIEAWVKHEPVAGMLEIQALVSKERAVTAGQNPVNGFALELYTTENRYLYRREADPIYELVDNVGFVAGAFQHIVATYENGMHVYVDGVEVKGEASTVALATTNGTFNVGAGYSGSDHFFSGIIDEVAVYDRALTAVQVLAHHRSATSR